MSEVPLYPGWTCAVLGGAARGGGVAVAGGEWYESLGQLGQDEPASG